jgi:hypothetical protein
LEVGPSSNVARDVEHRTILVRQWRVCVPDLHARVIVVVLPDEMSSMGVGVGADRQSGFGIEQSPRQRTPSHAPTIRHAGARVKASRGAGPGAVLLGDGWGRGRDVRGGGGGGRGEWNFRTVLGCP